MTKVRSPWLILSEYQNLHFLPFFSKFWYSDKKSQGLLTLVISYDFWLRTSLIVVATTCMQGFGPIILKVSKFWTQSWNYRKTNSNCHRKWPFLTDFSSLAHFFKLFWSYPTLQTYMILKVQLITYIYHHMLRSKHVQGGWN